MSWVHEIQGNKISNSQSDITHPVCSYSIVLMPAWLTQHPQIENIFHSFKNIFTRVRCASPWSAVAGVVVQNWLSAPTPRPPPHPATSKHHEHYTRGNKDTNILKGEDEGASFTSTGLSIKDAMLTETEAGWKHFYSKFNGRSIIIL